MNGTCRAEFFKGVAWPLHIDVAVDFQTLHLNIIRSAGVELKEFLSNCSMIFFDSHTEQVPNGEVHFHRLSGSHDIQMWYTNGPSNMKFSLLTLDNDLALKLAYDIYAALFTKQPYIVQKQEQVEAIPQQPIDPLAKARRRVDANLKKFFGYA